MGKVGLTEYGKTFIEKNSSDLTEFEVEDDVEYELEQARDEEGDFRKNGKFEVNRTDIRDADIGMISMNDRQLIAKKVLVGVKNANVYLPSTPATLPSLNTNIID